MSYAFQIPTTRKDSMFRKLHLRQIGEFEYEIVGIEYYQAFKLPIIEGTVLDSFVKVKTN